MGILNFFKKPKPSKFISEAAFNESMVNQPSNTHATFKQLIAAGMQENEEKSLKYFFYTNSLEKAAKLSDGLEKLHYSSSYGASDRDFIITGLTAPLLMTEENITTWASQMCALGYDFDCEFDGWGTEI